MKVFNNLKLRGSFGQTGGISGIGENDYVSTVSLGSTLMGVTSANQQSLWVSGITSKERGWELIQKQNYGIDFSVLKSRLSGSFDYYINDNKDMLMNITYPSVLGDIAPTTNSGHFQTKGWELALDWNDAAGDVRYSVGFNLGDNKSDVKLMAGKTLINPGKNDVVQGYPLGSIFVFKTNGYFPDAATANVYNTKYTGTGILPTGNAKVKEGSTERVDLNGDGKITNDDTYYYGDSQPHLYFGFKTRVSWKAFDFSALFQGVGKKNILRTGNLRAPFVAVSANQNASFLGNTWTPQNPNAEFPILSWEANLNKWNYDNNDFSVQNLRYIRLKNIVLGYSIPKKLISKAKIEGLRLYISADDIFEFTSVKDGYDPEYGEGSNNTYPFNRLVNFGVDITL